MFHYLVAVREYSSDFSVLSSLTLTFSGPGSPNQSCPRPRLPPAVGGRHLGRETYRSTTAQRADMQPKLHQTPLTRTTHLAGADSPKTQTTSPLAARCQRFSPRWSAMWAPQHCKPRPRRHQSGGIARHGGPTRWRHAARRLRVVQNPHRSQPEVRRVAYKYWAQGRLARKNSPNTAPPVAFPRKNSPSMHKNAEFGPF